jgi:hypothetical protein
MNKIIFEVRVQKNTTNYYRITLEEYMSKLYVNIREWFLNEKGIEIPTQKGITFNLELFPKIVDGLKKVEEAINDLKSNKPHPDEGGSKQSS